MTKSDTIYGTRAVMEAIKSGRQVEKIFLQKGLNNELVRELLQLARQHHVAVAYVPQEKLNRLSSKNHQGVVCLLSSIQYSSLDDLIHRVYTEGRDPFLLILDRITDVRNFGAIVRTAECAGVDGIVIPEKGNAPITSDAMKTSAGALNHMPVCREKDLRKTIRFLNDNGMRVVACTEKASETLYSVSLSGPIAIVLGSEEDGISDELIREADELARIPMKGKIESLNVSVAAGVVIFEAIRQRASAQ